MTDIPYIRTIKVAASSTTIIVENTTALVNPVKYKVGYLYMDSFSDSQCPLGCKTNNITLEVGTRH